MNVINIKDWVAYVRQMHTTNIQVRDEIDRLIKYYEGWIEVSKNFNEPERHRADWVQFVNELKQLRTINNEANKVSPPSY
jgi:hypothetical protein